MADYPIGTILNMKKKHPCGSASWVVLSSGLEYTLKCLGCGHVVLMKRDLVKKATISIEDKK